jgi:hypothetical protein
MNTELYRSPHGGWAATTSLPLVGNKQLRIDTRKRFGGDVTTTASVVVDEGNGMWTFAPFSDFSAQVIAARIRATERNVLAQHQTALAGIGPVKAAALEKEPTA